MWVAKGNDREMSKVLSPPQPTIILGIITSPLELPYLTLPLRGGQVVTPAQR